jgi:hypothetical protein
MPKARHINGNEYNCYVAEGFVKAINMSIKAVKYVEKYGCIKRTNGRHIHRLLKAIYGLDTYRDLVESKASISGSRTRYKRKHKNR